MLWDYIHDLHLRYSWYHGILLTNLGRSQSYTKHHKGWHLPTKLGTPLKFNSKLAPEKGPFHKENSSESTIICPIFFRCYFRGVYRIVGMRNHAKTLIKQLPYIVLPSEKQTFRAFLVFAATICVILTRGRKLASIIPIVYTPKN